MGLRAAAALVLGALLAGGCAQTYDATTLGAPATLASAASAPVAGDSFTVSTHAVYGFWGIASLKQPSVERTLAGQLVGGKALANVKISVHSSFTDVLFTVLTAGIIVPRSVRVEGIVTGP